MRVMVWDGAGGRAMMVWECAGVRGIMVEVDGAGMGMRRGTLRKAGGEADADLLGTGGQNIATSITSS